MVVTQEKKGVYLLKKEDIQKKHEEDLQKQEETIQTKE